MHRKITKTPTGRIPGTVMQFKIDERLKVVAAAMVEPKDPATVAVELCARFVDAGMITDDPDKYGCSFIEMTGPQYVFDICKVLAGYLYGDKSRSIQSGVFDALCRVTVLGDGDCPECGGELEFVETEGHELNDGDYYIPNSYEIDCYVYRCRVCGAIIKSEKEL